jgi:hypothetical protein
MNSPLCLAAVEWIPSRTNCRNNIRRIASDADIGSNDANHRPWPSGCPLAPELLPADAEAAGWPRWEGQRRKPEIPPLVSEDESFVETGRSYRVRRPSTDPSVCVQLRVAGAECEPEPGAAGVHRYFRPSPKTDELVAADATPVPVHNEVQTATKSTEQTADRMRAPRLHCILCGCNTFRSAEDETPSCWSAMSQSTDCLLGQRLHSDSLKHSNSCTLHPPSPLVLSP